MNKTKGEIFLILLTTISCRVSGQDSSHIAYATIINDSTWSWNICKPMPDTARAGTVKSYYYMWTANHETSSSWGENDIELNHKPSVKEVKAIVNKMMGKNWRGKPYLQIEEIRESNTVNESVEQRARKAYNIYLNQYNK